MKTTSEKSEMATLIDEQRTTNRLLAVIAIKGMEQSKAIGFLDSVGFEPRHIAAAIGITSNAVSIALHRMRKATAKSLAETATEEPALGLTAVGKTEVAFDAGK